MSKSFSFLAPISFLRFSVQKANAKLSEGNAWKMRPRKKHCIFASSKSGMAERSFPSEMPTFFWRFL